jgi:prepilin-type N-terminal cleavage/methylation domain-containing protein
MGAMNRRTRGFTLIEVLVVVVLGSILIQLAIKGFGLTSSQISVREARNVFNGMAARARAQAIESGLATVLIAYADGDSVVIVANGRTMENVLFGGDLGVDIQTSENITRICMNTRGYASPDCNSFDSVIKMAFVQGSKSATLEILPLGQIRW